MKRLSRAIAFTACAAAMLVPAMARADVRAGVEAWSRGDYARAIAEWRQPALDGDTDAQFNMGQAYKLGRGVPMDLKTAEDWFRRAAEQGHWQAANNYGLLLFQADRRAEAMPFISAAAGRGEPRAQYVLGTAHFNGDIVPKDWVRAYALMTRASSSGLAQASQSLATMDQYLSLEDRQRGIALAAELDQQAERARADTSLRPPRPSAPGAALAVGPATPRPIGSTSLPPSAAAGRPSGVAAAPAPVSVPATGSTPGQPSTAATAGADFSRQPTPQPPTPRPVPSAPVAAAATATPAAAPRPVRSGAWRVQLGAFGEPSRAEALWDRLTPANPALADLQPYLVKAGAVTRLQAGPFASENEAKSLCARLSGQACFPVRP